MNALFAADGKLALFCGTALRYLFPLLALWILARCIRPLLTFRQEPEVWAWLTLSDGTALPVTHWESVIGRSRGSDIVVSISTVSRSHAVLTRYDDGSWTICDIGSRGGVLVNGEAYDICAIEYGDVISLGGVELQLDPATPEERAQQAATRTRAGSDLRPAPTLMLLTLFQLLTVLQLFLHLPNEAHRSLFLSFGALMLLQWLLFLTLKALRRSSFEMETIAFFLMTIGLAVVASSAPSSMTKQLIAGVGGILLYLLLGWSLRDLERAKKLRYAAAVSGLVLLAANLAFGTEIYGAKNWIYIGPVSFQPSELVKLCFIFTGASTMDRIVTRRNLILFIAYSAVVCGCLALMRDFGTALVFFVCFLVIAYLRSGSFATIALSVAATGFAGSLALTINPHIKSRFKTWRHIWQYPDSGGYQQMRALMCAASGGLFGLGAGCGWLHYVAAADTDLVFALVCEEWGLLLAAMLVAAIACLGVFVVRSAAVGRSSFYTIAAGAAVAILITQTILNVFGTVDFLPLTGVTFPFLSNGGSSMLSSWGLLAFIKAADTRQNASFAVRSAGTQEVTE